VTRIALLPALAALACAAAPDPAGAVLGFGPGHDLGRGWTVRSTSPGAAETEVRIAGDSGGTVRALIAPSRPGRRTFDRTASLDVWYEVAPGDPPADGLVAAMSALSDAIRAADDGTMAARLAAAAGTLVDPLVMPLVAPLGKGDEVAPGWILHGAAVAGSPPVPAVRLRPSASDPAASGPTADLLLLPVHGPRPTGGCLATSRNYCLLPAGEGAALPGATDALATAARHVVAGDPEAHREPGSLRAAFRAGLAALFVVLVGLTIAVLAGFARATPPPWWGAAGLAALTALGAALRWTLSPWAFTHEFFHVADAIDGLLHNDVLGPYGETVPALVRAARALSGGDEGVIFATTALLAALTVPAVALLDLAVARRWDRALLAGAFVCLLPLHLRFSASESYHVPAVLFGPWAAALLVAWLDSRRPAALLGATVALALAVQCRPEAFLLAPILLLLVAATRPRRDLAALVSPPALGAAALLGALLSVRIASFGESAGSRAIGDLGGLRLADFALLDPAVTPWTTLAVVAAGTGWGAWRARGSTAWAAVSAAALTLLSLHFFRNEVYVQRSQALAVPFAAMLAAGAAPLATDLLRGRAARTAALAAVAALLAAGTVTHAGYVEAVAIAHREFEVVRDAAPSLPDGPGRPLVAATSGLARLPLEVVRRHGRLFDPVDLAIAAAEGTIPALPAGAVYWRGMACYLSDQAAVPGPSVPAACARLEATYNLRPISVAALPGPVEPGLRVEGDPAGPFEVGFFEIVGRSGGGPAAGGSE